MKTKKTKKTKLICLGMLLITNISFAQVGIGTDNPHHSSILELKSDDKGFLLPRLTEARRNAITSPSEGLVIYNTDSKCIEFYNGSIWVSQCTGITGIPNSNLMVSNPTYQGQSVIDNEGIGYNGETVPAASTITVSLSNSSSDAQSYGLVAEDPATGLRYSASGTIAGNASGVAVVLNNNQPAISWDTYGTITMVLRGADNEINLEPRIDIKSIPASATEIRDVSYGTQTWMDRNLGARRVAIALDDPLSYGNHYQWGRPADGHEISVVNSVTLTTGRGLHEPTSLEALANSDTPGHPNFILTDVYPYDWRSDNNNNRWATAQQGPCPTGYRVPTQAEWDVADNFGNWNNGTDAYNSTLKLPSAGRRSRLATWLTNASSHGYYWSTTVNPSEVTQAIHLNFSNSRAETTGYIRARGFSVRCIKN